MDWVRVAVVVLALLTLLAVALWFLLRRSTVDGEADPYQSRPDDQGRNTWRSSR